eukprot:10033390-Alexandrium_andersonii.AAC.1
MAEQTFREVKAKETTGRAMNGCGRPRVEQLQLGDGVGHWRALRRGRESGRRRGPRRAVAVEPEAEYGEFSAGEATGVFW